MKYCFGFTNSKFKALKQIEQQIKVVARKLDIEDILNKYPYEMSGGQKQRVASARAIVTILNLF